MNDKLTVLLTLKGRDHHTLRWLKYANDNHFPFPIYIADGQPCAEVKNYINIINNEDICNIKLEYHEYNDVDRIAFYNKVLDAMNRIDTKYVIFCGNNDFLFVPGLVKCISFLEQHEEYVCAGGGVSCMNIKPYDSEYLFGDILGFSYDNYVYKLKSYDEGSIIERMISILMDYSTIFFHVYRTAEWRKIASDVVDLKFSSPNIHEYFMALRTLTLGKVKSFPEYLTYIRGTGTSMSNNHPENSSDLKELLHYFLHSSYSEDIKKSMRHLEKVLASIDELKTGKELELLCRAFTYRQYITLPGISAAREIGIKQFIKDQAISKASRIYAMLANIAKRLIQPEDSPAHSKESKMFLINKLKNFGSDQCFLDDLSVELDKIRLCLGNNSSALISYDDCLGENSEKIKVLRKDEL